MRDLRRGDVRWYRFGRPDKERPVVVLTREPALEYLAEVTVAPVTSRVRDIPSEVPLSTGDGLPRDCAVNLDHVQTVPKAKLGPLLARLAPAQVQAVENALLFALGIRR